MHVPDPRIADDSAPNGPAVYMLWPRHGPPWLSRTAVLKRRLARLRALAGVDRIEYWAVASRLESSLLQYELARRHFPDRYLQVLKLRMPPFVKLLLANPFPRTVVTSRLSSSRSLQVGPFQARSAAEQFQEGVLDLFSVRRCAEDLLPSPTHPGCIYGEMGKCLRPCQQAVGTEEYASEAERLRQFLATGGKSLLTSLAWARDRLSEEMNFEEAARQHSRLERVEAVLKLQGGLAADIEALHGAAVMPSVEAVAVELFLLLAGVWQNQVRFRVAASDGRIESLDHRLRRIVAACAPARVPIPEKQEHLALLARWFYSSWRDGEWVSIENPAEAPYRKLVRAIHRVATSGPVD